MINKRFRRSSLLIAVTTLLMLVSAPPALGQCSVFTVDRPDELRSGRSLSIRLFEIKAPPNYTGEPVESLRIALAEKMRDSLLESKYFSSVVILPEDKQPQTDFIIEGEFTNVDEGSRAARVLWGTGAAQTVIQGRLVATNPSGRVFEFFCARATAGGWLSRGGVTSRGGKTLVHSNVEKFTENLKKIIPEVEKEMAIVKSGRRPPLVADRQEPDYDWRGKTQDQWSKKDCLKALSTFTISSKWKEGYVEAQWFSAPYYQSHLKISEMMRAGGITPTEFLRPKGLWLRWLNGGSLDKEPEIFKELEKEDAYIVDVTYGKNRPLYVERSKVLAATFLRRAGRPTERVAPLRIAPASVRYFIFTLNTSLLRFIFPTKLPDGTPLITNLNDKLELITEFEGRPATIHIDLSRFGLGRVEDLRLKPEAQVAETPATSSRPRAVSDKAKP